MNKILYKYQDWSNSYHRKSLIDSQAYFSNNFSFNDPFDLQLPIKTEGKLNFDAELFADDFKEETKRLPTTQELQLAKQKWDSTLIENKEIESIGELEFKQISAKFEDELGVLCLSKNCKSTLMWGHYSSSHSGYCIGYSYELLKQHITQKFGKRAQFLDVKYREEIPKLDYNKIFDNNYLREVV